MNHRGVLVLTIALGLLSVLSYPDYNDDHEIENDKIVVQYESNWNDNAVEGQCAVLYQNSVRHVPCYYDHRHVR